MPMCLGAEKTQMKEIFLICPETGTKIQHWLDDDEDIAETEYELFTCPACTKLHFINRKTGKFSGAGKNGKADDN
jgi:hypothetical protein